MNHGAVIEWVNRGLLPARRGIYNRWCIPFGPEVEARWRAHVANSPHVHADIDPRPPTSTERTVSQVAEILGIDPDAVYHWTAVGHVPWRRGPGGRKYIDFTPEVEIACLQLIASSSHLPTEIKSKAQRALTGGKV